MERRAELWRTLIVQAFTVAFSVMIPSLINFLILRTETPVFNSEFKELIQTVLKIFQNVSIAVGSVFALITLIQLSNSYITDANDEISTESISSNNNEIDKEQPSVADALENYLTLSNQVEDTEKTQNNVARTTNETTNQDIIYADQVSKEAIRVIRNKSSEEPILSNEQHYNEPKRVIRG